MSDEFLPRRVDLNVTLPQPIEVSADSSFSEVKKADIEMFNLQMRILHEAWSYAHTLPAVLALMKQTMDMIKHRRAILGFNYGPDVNQDSKAKRTVVFEPLA